MSSQTSYAPWLKFELYKLPVVDGLFPIGQFDDVTFLTCVEFKQSTNTDNLRVSFVIENYGFFYPNFGYMNLVIHNADSKGILGEINVPISTDTIPFMIGVRLYLGYETWSEPVLVFEGVATEILDSYIQPNNQLRFFCQFCPNNTTKNFTINPEETLQGALNRVLRAFHTDGDSPFSQVVLSDFFPTTVAAKPLAAAQPHKPRKPLHIQGKLSDCLGTISDTWGVTVNMSATSIAVVETKEGEPISVPNYLNRDAIAVNYTSGLIGSPTFFWQSNQVSFQTVLNPRFNFRTLFALEDIGGTIQGPTGTAINIANSRVRDTRGYPKIYTHRGDTRGSDWYTDVTGYVFPSIYNTPGLGGINLPGIVSCIGS